MGEYSNVDKLRTALQPRYWPIVGRKLVNRLRPEHRDDAQAWAAEHAESLDDFGRALAPELWDEARDWAGALRERLKARELAGAAPSARLGGPGDYQLMYFLTRYLEPAVVLETGVAAGFTSLAILSAIERNSAGRLYSSDLPYLGLQDAEEEVGRVVDPGLREHWTLALGGDRANLAEFLPRIARIDLVHYDSDKSAAGRRWAMDAIASKLSATAPVVMDDIGDNLFFRDWTRELAVTPRVFHRGGPYYVGLVGL